MNRQGLRNFTENCLLPSTEISDVSDLFTETTYRTNDCDSNFSAQTFHMSIERSTNLQAMYNTYDVTHVRNGEG